VEICVVIPAYNAVRTIRRVVNETVASGYPLLVVNDGSVDSTLDEIAGLPVELVNHRRNLGKGAALRSGFAWALERGYDGVVTLDSDGQHDPTAITRLVEVAEEGDYDIVIASRFSQFEEMAGLRRHWNRFGAWCMRKRTGFEIDDSQSGFRYYSARMLGKLLLESNGYEMEMEILMKGWRKGFRIGSIAVPAKVADGRDTSHFRPFRDTWNICMTFLRYM
jgi:glycosyltransferase involved in cell wall biosynthesis